MGQRDRWVIDVHVVSRVVEASRCPPRATSTKRRINPGSIRWASTHS